MSSFPFPSSPSNGDIYTIGSTTFTYNSSKDQWSGVAGTGGAMQYAQLITSSQTFTIPSGVTSIKATVIGGGGGGAGGSIVAGGGGGGGGAAIKYLNGLTPGGSITVTIGAAGGSWAVGGTTSIVVNGTTISATGGDKGATPGSGYRGTGGVGSNGDINIGGTSGGSGYQYGGAGGSSILGGGGSSGVDTLATVNGGTGRNYGGGGGGGTNDSYGPGNGGAGAPGVVIFEYTIASTSGNSGGGLVAWVNFDGTGSTSTNQTIRASFNVSSVFKNGTGDYTITFSTPLADANYVWSASGNNYLNDTANQVMVPLTTTTYQTASSLRVNTKAVIGGGALGSNDHSLLNFMFFR